MLRNKIVVRRKPVGLLPIEYDLDNDYRKKSRLWVVFPRKHPHPYIRMAPVSQITTLMLR